jgi:glycerophosphoryl diester phosphodiesterase
MNKIRFQAHRGVSSESPENTMAAFKMSVEQGYDIIELDPKYTVDGVCVVLHDKTLNRTCRKQDGSKLSDDKKLAIADITFEEARGYDAGAYMGEQFKGEKIPTLAETLEFIKDMPISCKIDNVWETFTSAQKDDLFRIVASAELGEKIGFTCQTLECFERAAMVFPSVELHWDGDLSIKTLERVNEIGAGHRITIWIRYNNKMTAWNKNPHATPELCERIRKYGDVGVWILSEEKELDLCVTELYADVIETTGHVKPFMLDKFCKN